MIDDVLFLLDRPLSLLVVLAIGAAIGIGVERFVEGQKRAERSAYWRGRKSQDKSGGKAVSLAHAAAPAGSKDAADQLRLVMNSDFKARALLNRPERRLLAHVDRALSEEAPGWRAMGQVALGEILASDDKDAFFAINAKRVDLLIVDEEFRPRHAIEFQGTGHHLPGNAAAARDAVKKEALRRAGIGYVEVQGGDRPGEVREMVRKLVARTKD